LVGEFQGSLSIMKGKEMGLLNWISNKCIDRQARKIVKKVAKVYRNIRTQHSSESERQILRRIYAYTFTKTIDELTELDERLIGKYAQSLNGICYLVGQAAYFPKDLSRQFIIFAHSIDKELYSRGFPVQTEVARRLWFEKAFPSPGMDWGMGLEGGMHYSDHC